MFRRKKGFYLLNPGGRFPHTQFVRGGDIGVHRISSILSDGYIGPSIFFNSLDVAALVPHEELHVVDVRKVFLGDYNLAANKDVTVGHLYNIEILHSFNEKCN